MRQPDTTPPHEPRAHEPSLETLYLDLLKKSVTRSIGIERYRRIDPVRGTWKRALYLAHLPLRRALAAAGVELVRHVDVEPRVRKEGADVPAEAETMVGVLRLDNLQRCIEDVLARAVPGDLLEAGVWRGGAAIFMRGVLAAHADPDRVVWAADSFAGLPPPDAEQYPADAGDRFSRNPHLVVSRADVEENFRRYGLLDDRVRFLEGWFRDTLPAAPVERLAVLRLDGDMYESTTVALEALYDKVSPGGYVIVDDYFAVRTGAGRATDDFRAQRGIEDELVRIDWAGAYWQRLR
ncbi:MAG: O-methyltransferase [Actinomycetota bacterium]|jgi:O-methyltransferase